MGRLKLGPSLLSLARLVRAQLLLWTRVRAPFRAHARRLAATCALTVLVACAQATQTYPLVTEPSAEGATGSVQVERIEGGQQLVVIEFDQLPPPERVGAGVREYVVWVEAEDGQRVRAGTLRYDRELRSGNLMSTTALARFTIRVTAERDANVTTPSSVLLAERKVVLN